MAVFLVCLVLLLSLTGHSIALYCLCKDGEPDATLQKSIDYACGSGADCSAILLNGSCYQPNTVKAHCDFAVNSYYQKKNNVNDSCDFAGTATTSATLPSTVVSGCVYQSSPSSTGSTTPSTTPTTGTTTTPSTTTSIPSPSVYTGLGPTTDTGNEGVSLHGTNLLFLASTSFVFVFYSLCGTMGIR